MPLSSNIDGSLALVATGCGFVTSLFHWAAVQTSGRAIKRQVMQGQIIASFGVGVAVAAVLNFQTLVEADAIMAFTVAAIVGFVYGPSALAIAARKGSEMYGFDPPPADQAVTSFAPPEDEAAIPAEQQSSEVSP